MNFELCSTCDDAGNMLAKRLEDSDFVRVVSSHDTQAEAETAKRKLMEDYKASNVAIGEGCLSIREALE
jgi:hypothetical protein